MKSLRTDIQALRGIAVGLVVLDHFKIGPFHQGFLGVDIFFVISGYLITSIIARDIGEKRFSFVEFYLRRAKRILPAAYVTILLTSIGSIWFLNSFETSALTAQTIGALTYTINIVLWRQVGYFDVAAGFKPLLHMWSLAIEEQFYLLFPTLLVALPRQLWLRGVALIGVASFAACVVLAWKFPTAAFYLLPTRAWELLLGSLGALAVAQGYRVQWANWLLVPALAAIAALSVKGTGLPHPGLDALLVCVATLIVILANNAPLARFPATAALGLVGNISYSLYLVHWPIVVFVNSVWITPPSESVRVGALVVAVALATVLYVVVEQPLRKLPVAAPRYAALSLLTALGLIGVQIGVQAYTNAGFDAAFLRRPNHGLNRLCDNYIFENRTECKTQAEPQTLVWGDSYAMFFASGAQYRLDGGMVQATYSACPPFIGYAPYNPARDDARSVSKYCIEFNDGVRSFALQRNSVRTVILAASFWQYSVSNFQMMRRDATGQLLIEASGLERAQENLERLVRELRSSGKSVVIVTPPPGTSDGNVICSERKLSGKFLVGGSPSCDTPASSYWANVGSIESLISAGVRAGARNIRLSDAICDQDACHTMIDGVALYRDPGHLSYAGAKKVLDILAEKRLLPPPFGS